MWVRAGAGEHGHEAERTTVYGCGKLILGACECGVAPSRNYDGGPRAESRGDLVGAGADSAAASSFLAGVLSMDDYPFFKREMLSLKRDLFAEPNFDALDAHVLAAGPLREPSRLG